MSKTFKRILKSKTINAAHVIVVLGALQANNEFLSAFLSQKQMGVAMSAIGIAMYILRAFTTEGLKEK